MLRETAPPTQRDTYNACVQAFVDHDYCSALLLANNLAEQGTHFPIYMILLISAQRTGRSDLVKRCGDQVLEAASKLPWEQLLVRFILERIESTEILSHADTNDRLCQAHYYIGARWLTSKEMDRARESFQVSVSQASECIERVIAMLEIERFEHPAATDDDAAIKNPRLKSGTGKIWEFEELLDKLMSERRAGYVYRGQTQLYDTLLPSGYRASVDMRPTAVIIPQDGESLHNRGRVCRLRARVVNQRGTIWIEGESLYGRGRIFRALLPNSLWPEAEKRRVDFVSLCRAQLGYLLSQLFCQHCCLPTEGLDVTEELGIAAFFALFDYERDAYVDDDDNPGVIFRIDVGERQALSTQFLRETDFYSCPLYVNGAEILNLLGRCATHSDSLGSLAAYFREWQRRDLDVENWPDIRKSRPLELIELPELEVSRGRVIMQRAGLVFPDVMLPRWYEESPVVPPPGKTWDGPQCIEDLIKSDVVETFLFRHHMRNRKRVGYDPSVVFPSVDPLRSLLSRMIGAMSGGSGAIPIVVQDASVFRMGDEEDLPS